MKAISISVKLTNDEVRSIDVSKITSVVDGVDAEPTTINLDILEGYDENNLPIAGTEAILTMRRKSELRDQIIAENTHPTKHCFGDHDDGNGIPSFLDLGGVFVKRLVS